MFRRIQTFSGQLSFACAILLVYILGARNEAFAQNVVSEYDVFGDANITDDAIHFRTKRATYNTFIAAHTVDPTTPGFPFRSHAQWMSWYRSQEKKHTTVYKRDHKGKNPFPFLTQKPINTIIITSPSRIQQDFARATTSNGNLKWSRNVYRVVNYTSKKGANPQFYKCPDDLFILAALDNNGQPMHLEAICDHQQVSGSPKSCYPFKNKCTVIP